MSLATAARPYGPPWHRTGSVTALGAELLLPLKEGIWSSTVLACWGGTVPGRTLSGHPQAAALAKTTSQGRVLAGCLCCFYCFIISQVKKREGCSFCCNLLTRQLSGAQPWLNPVNYTVLAFLNHRLVAHSQSSQITDALLFFVPSFTNSPAPSQ